jgi:hypothetical protein
MKTFFLCFAVLLAALNAFGQGLTSLSGTVTDPTGAVIPGATLVLENVERGVKRESVSDAAGRYAFPQVQPDNYRITAKAPGFADVVINDVRLLVNSPATVNVQFEKVGAVAETISVSAEAIQVNTTDASLGNAIGTQAITQLPFYVRNVAALLAYQPGVTSFEAGDDRDGSVNGGKSDQANITLDGADVNDQVNRSAFTSVLRVTLDSVQEFRTTTASGNADAGRGSGAEVALVTKSGSNEFHGSAYEYHRNTITAANSFFSNRTNVPRAALLINVFGASLGGPIKKNRTFVFFNYEGRRDASASIVTRTVPTDTLRQGIVQFRNTAGAVVQVTPEQIKQDIDPLHIGANPASLKIFNLYPRGNDNSIGDSLNTIGFRFNAPRPLHQNTYIARFDHQLDSAGKHSLFLRGNLQNDGSNGSPQFPGQQPNSVTLANNKGLAAGWTALLKPTLVSTFRYGLTRVGGETTGILSTPYSYFRGYDNIYGTTTGTARIVPVHNVTQDFGWTQGAHDIRFGGTLRFIKNGSTSYANSFPSAVTNASFLKGSGADLTPASLNVSKQDNVSYTYAMVALLGIITQGNGRYNYQITGDPLPVGAPRVRHYKNEEYEMYVQDSWKVLRNLTITGGLRYSLMPPVYEADGIQISPDRSFSDWLNQRGALAQQGRSQAEAGDITYVLANSAQGRPMYPYHKNWAPRLSLAYSPTGDSGLSRFLFGGPGKTSIRAGAGMYYDLIGQPLANTYNATAFGLSSSTSNPGNTLTSITAPRFTDFNTVPASLVPPAPKLGFPVKAPSIFAITNSIDDKLKAPYTTVLNFSIGREFSHGWYVQGAYVGRLSRRSLIQRDLAMPTDLKDPKSGQTYFQAMSQLGTLIDFQKVPISQLPKIPFFENMWATAAAGGLTATQVIGKTYAENSIQGDFTNVLNEMDEVCDPAGTTLTSKGFVDTVGCSILGPNAMFNRQFSALSGWSSIASGAYHAMQWTVRKRFGQGVMLDFNYTLSKSIDLASRAENVATFSGFVRNSWNPGQLRGVSDYDTLHAANAIGVWQLPFGKGQRFGSGVGRALDALIGGWQITGTYRQSSGLPTSVSDGSRWATNWQLSSWATPNGKPRPPVTNDKNAPTVSPTGAGGPNLWSDPKGALAGFDLTLAGQTGSRNTIRGQGFFNIDTGLAKSFTMPYKESHRLQIRWETFNVTNACRFDPTSASLSLTATGTFGRLSGQLGAPRQMQFAARYEF